MNNAAAQDRDTALQQLIRRFNFKLQQLNYSLREIVLSSQQPLSPSSNSQTVQPPSATPNVVIYNRPLPPVNYTHPHPPSQPPRPPVQLVPTIPSNASQSVFHLPAPVQQPHPQQASQQPSQPQTHTQQQSHAPPQVQAQPLAPAPPPSQSSSQPVLPGLAQFPPLATHPPSGAFMAHPPQPMYHMPYYYTPPPPTIPPVPLAPSARGELSSNVTTASMRLATKSAAVTKRQPTCTHCGAVFTQRSNLNKHVRTVHLKERLYKCDECDSDFGHKNLLLEHKRTKHRGERPFKCAECGATFGRRSNKYQHEQLVHGKRRDFICQTCGLHFGLKGNLTKHIRLVHEKLRPHACDLCDSTFGLKSDLKRHRAARHKGAPPLPETTTASAATSAAGSLAANGAACVPCPTEPTDTARNGNLDSSVARSSGADAGDAMVTSGDPKPNVAQPPTNGTASDARLPENGTSAGAQPHTNRGTATDGVRTPSPSPSFSSPPSPPPVSGP